MVSFGRIFTFVFGVKISCIYKGLMLFSVLKTSVAKVRNLLISIVVVGIILFNKIYNRLRNHRALNLRQRS